MSEPKTERSVQLGLVACPTCYAPAEEWCWTRAGRRAPKLHEARLAIERTVSEPSKTAAQLLREVATADPEGHRRRLARGYDGSLAGCTCAWWTPEDGLGAGVPQRQLNPRNDCPVPGHNTFLAGGGT